ncbi:hypothetical protein RRG08_037330 [Elysia crispata]|uniref:Uncharacterized protein n=1 Tax=Elysia crispata TaxID=231223 RepID=A0AAE1AG90_9GAST|nr:hypothetical protein RRG08_037330 [Elysia crispata]
MKGEYGPVRCEASTLVGGRGSDRSPARAARRVPASWRRRHGQSPSNRPLAVSPSHNFGISVDIVVGVGSGGGGGGGVGMPYAVREYINSRRLADFVSVLLISSLLLKFMLSYSSLLAEPSTHEASRRSRARE